MSRNKKINDAYAVIQAEIFDLANKEELTWWDKQKLECFEITTNIFNEYTKLKHITLIEPIDEVNKD